jgi:hypothetical protein
VAPVTERLRSDPASPHAGRVTRRS